MMTSYLLFLPNKKDDKKGKILAEVIEFSDGKCALRWMGQEKPGVLTFSSLSEVKELPMDPLVELRPYNCAIWHSMWEDLRGWWRFAVRCYGRLHSRHSCCPRLDAILADACKHKFCDADRVYELLLEEQRAEDAASKELLKTRAKRSKVR